MSKLIEIKLKMNKSDGSCSFEQLFQEFIQNNENSVKTEVNRIYDQIVSIIDKYKHIFDLYSIEIDNKEVIKNKSTGDKNV